MKIEDFIIKKFGQDQGNTIIKLMKKELNTLVYLYSGESKSNIKTMQTQILPRIALYKALQNIMFKEEAYSIVWAYTKMYLCVPKSKQYALVEKVPFFFPIFKKVFLHTVLNNDAWKTKLT